MRAALLGALLLLALALAGCTGTSQRGVSNEPGHFQYGGGLAAKTGTESFTWQNPSPAAKVSWGGGGSGSLRLVVRDAAGAPMLERALAGTGGDGGFAQTTAQGQPGAWTVRLDFEGFSGGMGLELRSA